MTQPHFLHCILYWVRYYSRAQFKCNSQSKPKLNSSGLCTPPFVLVFSRTIIWSRAFKMDPSHCNELALTLDRTLSPLLEERRRAENVLKSMEHQPGYSVCLLGLLQDLSRPKTTRLSAATTLKNFIKRYWKTVRLCKFGDFRLMSNFTLLFSNLGGGFR